MDYLNIFSFFLDAALDFWNKNEQLSALKPVEINEYLIIMVRDTMENWQSGIFAINLAGSRSCIFIIRWVTSIKRK